MRMHLGSYVKYGTSINYTPGHPRARQGLLAPLQGLMPVINDDQFAADPNFHGTASIVLSVHCPRRRSRVIIVFERKNIQDGPFNGDHGSSNTDDPRPSLPMLSGGLLTGLPARRQRLIYCQTFTYRFTSQVLESSPEKICVSSKARIAARCSA
jgi:hypothetical protein